MDSFEPVIVDFREAFRNESRTAVGDRPESCRCKRFHFNEPLFCRKRFDGRFTARAMPDGMIQFFPMVEKPQFPKIFHNGPAAFPDRHALIFCTGPFIHRTVQVHDHNRFEMMPFAHFKVVRVMGRRNLNGARTEFTVHVLIADNFRLSVDKGDEDLFADVFFHLFIMRVDCDSRIAHDCFRAGRRDHDVIVFTDYGVFDIPQMPGFILMIDFNIAKRRMAMRAPVRNPPSLIDKPFFIERNEYFADGTRAYIVHGKPFTAPIAGRTEASDLLFNTAAVFFFPRPNAFQKFFTPYIITCFPFFFSKLFFHLDLRCDPRMIRTGDPDHVIAFHPFKTHEDILERIVERMAHMKLTRYIGRGHDDAEGLTRRFGFLMEIPFFFPKIIPLLFDFSGIIPFEFFFIPFLFDFFGIIFEFFLIPLLPKTDARFIIIPFGFFLIPFHSRLLLYSK